MTIEVLEYRAPSHWASYLINGDASGMTDDEQAECDAWQESCEPAYVISCKNEEEPSFERFYFKRQMRYLGTDVITYLLHKATS